MEETLPWYLPCKLRSWCNCLSVFFFSPQTVTCGISQVGVVHSSLEETSKWERENGCDVKKITMTYRDLHDWNNYNDYSYFQNCNDKSDSNDFIVWKDGLAKCVGQCELFILLSFRFIICSIFKLHLCHLSSSFTGIILILSSCWSGLFHGSKFRIWTHLVRFCKYKCIGKDIGEN